LTTTQNDIYITISIKVGGVEKIAADMKGGKHGERRRVAILMGGKSAVGTRSATELAQQRRVCGSDPPLWRISHSPPYMRKEKSLGHREKNMRSV
jgi:hypothetical protein